jgi:hypothetical protein
MKLLLLSITLVSMSYLAVADDSKKAERFNERKAHALENVEKRITILSTFKTCISAAQNKDAVKACRKANKSSMKSLKEAGKAYREKMKAQRKNKK